MSPQTTPTQAIRAYVDYLNQLFNTILTDSRLSAISRGPNNIIDRYQAGLFQPLELAPKGFLHFRQFVRAVNAHIEIESYEYTYSLSDNRDDEQAWVCRYHYDRRPEHRNLPHAHLHINAAGRGAWDLKRSLRRTHFPTRRMSVEHLLWYVIDEGRARSKLSRAQTLRILSDSYRGFVQHQTDSALAIFP